MKKFNPGQAKNSLFAYCIRAVILSLILLVSAFLISVNGQSLTFEDPTLESGTPGLDGAVYRFSSVAPNIDATLKIRKRSSSLVTLDEVDVSDYGWQKAFQPRIGYNGGIVTGAKEWWMEFEMTFLKSGTDVPAPVIFFNLTALDVDGDAYTIQEFMELKGAQSYTFETNSQLSIFPGSNDDNSGGGYKFLGPITNYVNIDTTATQVMVTCKYYQKNKFKFKIGAKSNGTGTSNATSRYNSIWFKTFNYIAPRSLPVSLTSFSVGYDNKKAQLSWVTEAEKNTSHFVIQRSVNGKDFNDAAIIFTFGNSDTQKEYRYADQIILNNGFIWYRLKIVDLDGNFSYSTVKLVRTIEEKGKISVLAYPNPAINELTVTVPLHWQNKIITYSVYNRNGYLIRQVMNTRSGQTEIIDIKDLQEGIYFIKVFTRSETTSQQFIKIK